VNLRVVEREVLPLVAEWRNSPEIQGEFIPIVQESRAELEKRYDSFGPNEKRFFIEKKDGSKIGLVVLEPREGMQEIGYRVIPSERRKGYCTEAVKLIVDYLFLSQEIVRVQAHTDVENVVSQRVLVKAGFKKEGLVRKHIFVRGDYRDEFLYSILREEWKEPKTLTKVA